MDEMSLSTRNEIRNCIHSRKIQAFSANPEHPKFEIFRRHLNRCASCRVELAREREFISNIVGIIPGKLPLESQLSDIRSELKEALKGLQVVDRTSYQFRFLTTFRVMEKGMKDTVHNAFRPKFALWMGVALAFGFFFGR